MATENSGLGSCVVVVGDPAGELVQTVVQWAREGEIDAVACDRVYSAVAHIARAAGRRVLVVGSIKELARENGAFFRIAAAHGVPCGGLLDRTDPVAREGLLAALGAGVTVFGAVPDVRGVLKEWRATPPRCEAPRVLRDAADTSYEELRATEAELGALLG